MNKTLSAKVLSRFPCVHAKYIIAKKKIFVTNFFGIIECSAYASLDHNFAGEIHRGALGSSEYRKTRFLTHADDGRAIHWALQFISEWHPTRIQKQDHYLVLPIFEQ